MFEALTLAPDQPQVRLTLAAIYNGTGQLDLARTELQSIADLQPRNDEVHRRIGRILALQGDRSGAVEAYRQAIVLRP
ncbi:MAG: tetratricopeptide repeat protein, partial [Vicinamibacterales bacterium]|nr:tetratricopeptide repeat protein [Vicinamibacterales bacterium]